MSFAAAAGILGVSVSLILSERRKPDPAMVVAEATPERPAPGPGSREPEVISADDYGSTPVQGKGYMAPSGLSESAPASTSTSNASAAKTSDMSLVRHYNKRVGDRPPAGSAPGEYAESARRSGFAASAPAASAPPRADTG